MLQGVLLEKEKRGTFRHAEKYPRKKRMEVTPVWLLPTTGFILPPAAHVQPITR